MVSTVGEKIVWLVDAYTEDKDLFEKTARVLAAYHRRRNIPIQPLYVMSPDQLGVSPIVFSSIMTETKPAIEKKLRQLIDSAGLVGILPPAIVISRNISLTSAINAALEYGRANQATLIVTSSLSRKGVSHFLFGSFAESLVLRSDIPTVVITPKMQPAPMRHMLFTTDLGETSREAFELVVREAQRSGQKLTLFNRYENYFPYGELSFHLTPQHHTEIEADLKRRGDELQRWADRARKNSVEAEAKLDRGSSNKSVSDSIFSAAKEVGADCIGVTSQSGPLVRGILGSTTRQVLRLSECPVWVFHPQNKI